MQHKLSSESTPVLSSAIPTFESFMTKWETISRDSPHLAQFINKGLDSAYKYYKQMDRTHAYIIAMCWSLTLESGITDDCKSSNQPICAFVVDS